MRHLRRRDRGLSEIVGTLMLIVIVVSAATLLAAFVASYQKTLQSQEAYAHEQSLESIKVLGLTTTLNATGSAYSNISFRLADESVEASTVLGIAINSVILYNYSWEDLSTQTWTTCSLHSACTNLSLASLQQVEISNNSNSWTLGAPPAPNQYLKIDVYTTFQNDFRQVFLPPAPIGLVSEVNPSGNNPITLVDGSTSFQPGGNASLVSWAWTISGGGLTSTGTSLPSNPANYSTPQGSIGPGLESVARALAIFSVPAGFNWQLSDSAIFALGGANLAISGTGTCDLSDSAISSSSGAVSAGILTIEFYFNTTVSSGCSGATISLAPSGVTFLAIAGQAIATATGEETEISPALPLLPISQPEYQVVLQVVNSNGMTGSVGVTYDNPV
jgi:flagellin-like protein